MSVGPVMLDMHISDDDRFSRPDHIEVSAEDVLGVAFHE
jgi:hypothetical protein